MILNYNIATGNIRSNGKRRDHVPPRTSCLVWPWADSCCRLPLKSVAEGRRHVLPASRPVAVTVVCAAARWPTTCRQTTARCQAFAWWPLWLWLVLSTCWLMAELLSKVDAELPRGGPSTVAAATEVFEKGFCRGPNLRVDRVLPRVWWPHTMRPHCQYLRILVRLRVTACCNLCGRGYEAR